MENNQLQENKDIKGNEHNQNSASKVIKFTYINVILALLSFIFVVDFDTVFYSLVDEFSLLAIIIFPFLLLFAFLLYSVSLAIPISALTLAGFNIVLILKNHLYKKSNHFCFCLCLNIVILFLLLFFGELSKCILGFLLRFIELIISE